MKQSEKEFRIVQQICGKNMAASNVLLKLADAGRFDIVEFIKDMNDRDANNAIDPEDISRVYHDKCNCDIKQLIKLIDKQFKTARKMRREFDYEDSI